MRNHSMNAALFSISFVSLAGCSNSSIAPNSPEGTDDTSSSAEDSGATKKKSSKKTSSSDKEDGGATDASRAADAHQEATQPLTLVSPTLSQSPSGVYTISFRLKNGSSTTAFRAFNTLKVSAGPLSFPTIDSKVCPESTPGYPWGVAPLGLSDEVGIAFSSNKSTPKTVIDLTCGTKEALQSIPAGFDAAPPFVFVLDGVMDDGSSVTLKHTFSDVTP